MIVLYFHYLYRLKVIWVLFFVIYSFSILSRLVFISAAFSRFLCDSLLPPGWHCHCTRFEFLNCAALEQTSRRRNVLNECLKRSGSKRSFFECDTRYVRVRNYTFECYSWFLTILIQFRVPRHSKFKFLLLFQFGKKNPRPWVCSSSKCLQRTGVKKDLKISWIIYWGSLDLPI